MIVIRDNEKAEDTVNHVQHSCPSSTPATFHPSAAHLFIHKNYVMSSVPIGWVGGCGRVRGPPDLYRCVCENKTTAEVKGFTKLRRLYSEDKKR